MSGESDPAPGDDGVSQVVRKFIQCPKCTELGGGCTCRSGRRRVLKGMGAAAGGVAAVLSQRDIVESVGASQVDRSNAFAEYGSLPPEDVFPQSVMSGGPTTSGVILWTRIHPDVHSPEVDLGIEVAHQNDFEDLAFRGTVSGDDIAESRDYTVRVDLDGELDSDSFYYYRFTYDGTRSRVGRCRTLPASGDSPEELSFGLVTCQHYQNGYFKAFDYLADDDIDFVLHMGDFIYETAGGVFTDDGASSGRDLSVPSRGRFADKLRDFRHLYKEYKKDRNLQRALESHTMIAGWDDHEVANDRYWNHEEDHVVLPHWEWVYSDATKENRIEEQTKVTANAIQAWVEQIPARVDYDPDADHLHDMFQMYRKIEMGDLGEVLVTDERLYRSKAPCDDLKMCRGGGITDHDKEEDPDWEGDNTMLGDRQKEWMFDQLNDSDATWTVWLNEVLAMPLTIHEGQDQAIELVHSSWDGYRAERHEILNQVDSSSVSNFLTVTGDLHAAAAGYLKTSYPDTFEPRMWLDSGSPPRSVGVELMTPAITSANIAEYMDDVDFPGPDWLSKPALKRELTGDNEHLKYVDYHNHGYSVLDLSEDGAHWTVYGVDKSNPDADRKVLASRHVRAGDQYIEDAPTAILDASKTDIDPGDTVDFSAAKSHPGDGDIESYEWDFGDGNSATGESVSHTYDEEGRYLATLTVEDDTDFQDTASVFVDVDGSSPTAVIGVDDTTVTPGETVEFTGADSSDPEEAIASYEWKFGDGTSATGKTVTHSYSETGDYDVTLRVTDEEDASATATKTIEVTEGSGISGRGAPDHVETMGGDLDADGDTGPVEEALSYDIVSDVPEAIAAVLDGPAGGDFDLFVTLDGRTPDESDFDYRSRTPDADELIEVEGEDISSSTEVGILVRAYGGQGSYTLTMKEWKSD